MADLHKLNFPFFEVSECVSKTTVSIATESAQNKKLLYTGNPGSLNLELRKGIG